MVQVKKYSSSNLYELRSNFPKLPEIRFHDNSERNLYHLFDTSKESIFGINLAKNCPFQPSHPSLNTNFQMLDYSLPQDAEQKTGWEIE
jgi:hypothetical protein